MTPQLLAFCLRSLYREYGKAFLWHVMLRHPVSAMRGMARYARGEVQNLSTWNGGAGSLVGVGFCLKPLSPACPSGRPNHDCLYFESNPSPEPEPCRGCLIRRIGLRSQATGSTLYVMTSARDILQDVLLPSVRQRRFHSAVLAICNYSFEPIRLALSICGIQAALVPFQHGDCRDYAAWRRADIGIKPEQTCLDAADLAKLTGLISGAPQATPAAHFRKRGHLFEPD